MPSALNSVPDILAALGAGLWDKFADIFLAPGSLFSIASLATAFFVAVAFVSLSRAPGRRWVKPRVLMRAFFPKRIVRGASTRADLGLFLFNNMVAGVLFGGMFLSAGFISEGAHAGLVGVLGVRTTELASPALGVAILTLTAFLAYEFGYWLDHYLMHKVPLLWEFHKVHHTAEHLTPLTNFRTHPVDSVLFGNMLALTIGSAHGVTTYAIGRDSAAFTLNGANVIVVAFLFLILHLQHTHLWIAFTGVWGRLFVSPAHHQLHHSDNPQHFGGNFGSCLAIWDWMFGTLRMPTRTRQRLSFGVTPVSAAQHSVTGVLITPFVAAAAIVMDSLRRPPFARPVSRLY